MPRSISWHARLNEMHRQVSESPRTPYTREDIEKLFRVKLAAAKQIVTMLPRVVQGNSSVVEREDLIEFLGQCMDAEDLRAHLDAIRRSPPRPRRRRLRVFVPRDFIPTSPRTASAGIHIFTNELSLSFTTAEDLVSKLYQVATMAEAPAFQRRYCTEPKPSPEQKQEAEESRRIRLHNRYLQKVHSTRQAADLGMTEIAATLRAEADTVYTEWQQLTAAAGLPGDELLTRASEMLAALFPASSAESSSRTG